MPDEICAFARPEETERDCDQVHDLVKAARARRAKKRVQLRKRELNPVEVGAVGRQEAQVRAGPCDGGVQRFRRFTHARLTEYLSASSFDGMPASESRNTRVRRIHRVRRHGTSRQGSTMVGY